MFIPNWMVLLVIAIFLLYKWAVASYNHFLKLNVVHDKPCPFFGTFGTIFFEADTVLMLLMRQYQKYKHKSYFGIYQFRKPILVLTDPTLIRETFVTHADHFMMTGGIFNRDYVLRHSVGEISTEKWTKVRSALEQCFLPTNLRHMFYSIEECSEQLIGNLKVQIAPSSAHDIDVFQTFAGFFADVLTIMTFGMRSNSLASNNKNVLSETMMSMKPKKSTILLTQFLMGNFQWIAKRLRISPIDKDFVAYFLSLVKEIIAYRHKHGIQHFDIVHILMNQSADLSEDPKDQTESIPSFTNDEVVAQCFIVLVSAHVKCSLIATSAVLELAANPHIQRKLQSEIDRVSEKINGNKFTYDVIEAMDYLNLVVHETLRKWPGDFSINRVCTNAYKVCDESSGHSIMLQPGDCICVPTCALHWDPDYFPEPLKFDPERFNENRRGFIRPYTFLPFGIGTRSCCGAKLALIQIKAALISLFSEFDAELKTGKQGDLRIEDSIYCHKSKNNRIVRLKRRNQQLKLN